MNIKLWKWTNSLMRFEFKLAFQRFAQNKWWERIENCIYKKERYNNDVHWMNAEIQLERHTKFSLQSLVLSFTQTECKQQVSNYFSFATHSYPFWEPETNSWERKQMNNHKNSSWVNSTQSSSWEFHNQRMNYKRMIKTKSWISVR